MNTDAKWCCWLTGSFQDYDRAISDQLESAFRASPTGGTSITVRGETYRVSFAEMKQQLVSDPAKARRVKRVDRNSGRSTVHPFCGRTHAAEYSRLYPHGVCQLPGCNIAAAFDEVAQRAHPFCCKSHARRGRGVRQPPWGIDAQPEAPEEPPLGLPIVDALPVAVPVCVVCMVEDVSHILAPCGHQCLCGPCSQQLTESSSLSSCPICRARVESVVGPVFQ